VTIAFVLIAALMLLAALAFVVPPLLRGATDHSASEARRKLRALEQKVNTRRNAPRSAKPCSSASTPHRHDRRAACVSHSCWL